MFHIHLIGESSLFLLSMKVVRHITYIVIFLLFPLLILSCSNENNDEPFIPIDEISTLETYIYPDKNTKTISTTLSFKNIKDIDYILITMSGGMAYSEKINGNLLTSNYRYSYKIRETDPESFTLLLRAVYKDGNMSNQLSLKIDNRWGFFIRSVSRTARLTGSPMSSETLYNPNNTTLRWNVGGTDLGIIWEMQKDNYGIFFGDTFGRDFKPNQASPGPNGSSWRSNVLAFTDDKDLEDGITINSMAEDERGDAREIVFSAKSGTDVTSIPTAAIRSGGYDYVHFFNMRDWNTWTTNYSGMYKSEDDGHTWNKVDGIHFSSDSPFGQVGYFKKDGYVYMIGTKTGRSSSASLARFLESDIENQNLYEYWNSKLDSWVTGNEKMATTIIDDEVGELSFIYNEKLNRWSIAYFNETRYNITMRTAEKITGPWSQPYELVSGWEYAQLYGSYIHPISVNSETIYFTMSMWLPYNVFLMKAMLADMGEFN